jgi:hypothetical protein
LISSTLTFDYMARKREIHGCSGLVVKRMAKSGKPGWIS